MAADVNQTTLRGRPGGEFEADHVPVLLHEVLEWLDPKPGGRYLDGTLGLAGHAGALLERTGGEAKLMGLDRDEHALEKAAQRLEPYTACTELYHLAYSRFEVALADAEWDSVDGALLDLGVSSLQLDTPERGFSFTGDGPLDMRMDMSGGRPPASRLVNKSSHKELVRMIARYGEEPMAGRIATAIIKARGEKPIETTLELARIVENAYPAKWRAKARTHPATRTFQALRMAVNEELKELETFLDRIPRYLAPGGRVAVISFHSLEDRLVKRSFRDMARECVCPPGQPQCFCGREKLLEVLTRKPIMAGEEETARNPRARSAKLRVAERTGGRS